MRKRDSGRLAPLGMPLSFYRALWGWGSAAAALYSFSFLVRYFEARSRLFDAAQRLRQGAVMADFQTLLHGAFLGFGMLALCFAALAVFHYAYHFQGAKSIYTMRRLPSRWELHRRCLAIPALGLGWCLLCVLALTLGYYALYVLATPDACLTGGQWQRLLEAVFSF